jgi:hypothetical protein
MTPRRAPSRSAALGEPSADGTLRLRVRVALNLAAMPPADAPKAIRITLFGLAQPLVIERALDGAWST